MVGCMADQPSSTQPSGDPATASPFHSLDEYVALPRVNGLTLSPDGARIVCPVQTLNKERTKYVTSLWEVDPDGEKLPRRLTRSVNGESAPAFLPNGDLLFVSKRSELVKDVPDDKKVGRRDDGAVAAARDRWGVDVRRAGGGRHLRRPDRQRRASRVRARERAARSCGGRRQAPQGA